MNINQNNSSIYTNLLSEYDEDRNAIISPSGLIKSRVDFPEIVVMTFTRSIVDKWADIEGSRIIGYTASANGKAPVYSRDYQGQEVAFCMAPVGASICAGMLEDIIAMGGKKFVVFGSCGVLNREIADGHMIIPDEAMRDEGTSYHYAPPSDSIFLNPDCVQTIINVMESLKFPYTIGKTWTTDAIYRETVDKMKRRKEAGCIVVEMECAALTAVAQFRGVKFAQFLYAADNLDSPVWEQRGLCVDQGLSNSEQYMQVAFECGIKL